MAYIAVLSADDVVVTKEGLMVRQGYRPKVKKLPGRKRPKADELNSTSGAWDRGYNECLEDIIKNEEE